MLNKLKYLLCYALIVMPSFAFAALSDRSSNVSEEGAAIGQDIVFLFKLGGIVIFLAAVAALISKKKKNQPLDWEVWGIVGGAVLTVSMIFLTDTTESLTGQDQETISTQRESGF